MIKVLQGCILKLLLHSVNSVPILYWTGNMLSAILLSFLAYSSILPCGLQSTHPQMPCYISPYVVCNVYGGNLYSTNVNEDYIIDFFFLRKGKEKVNEHIFFSKWKSFTPLRNLEGSRTSTVTLCQSNNITYYVK